ncbi:MAG: hypothetical protein ACPGVU_21030, partial [Limisphaerales bacterium]
MIPNVKGFGRSNQSSVINNQLNQVTDYRLLITDYSVLASPYFADLIIFRGRMDIFEEMQWRGLVADCTDPDELLKRLSTGPITLYCGFDPTADSLHV